MLQIGSVVFAGVTVVHIKGESNVRHLTACLHNELQMFTLKFSLAFTRQH